MNSAGRTPPGPAGADRRTGLRLRLRQIAIPAAFALGAMAAVFAPSASPARGATLVAGEGVVATIDGEAITGAEFAAFLRGYLRTNLYHGGSPERVRALAARALDELIANRLLLRAAIARGIEGDPATVRKEMASIRERYAGTPQWPEIEAKLPEIERDLRDWTRLEELRRRVAEVAPPDEATLRAYYESNAQLFTLPESWDLDMILIGVPPWATAVEWVAARSRAAALFERIRAGESFAELAAANSTDEESAARGGALGRVHAGQIPGEAVKAIAALAPGEIAEPVRILEGYAIFRLNDRYPAELQPFDAVRERVEALYRRDASRRQLEAFLADLRERARIETYDISAYVEEVAAKR